MEIRTLQESLMNSSCNYSTVWIFETQLTPYDALMQLLQELKLYV
jgi:hypothetical protein